MIENSFIVGKERKFVFHFIFSTGMTTFKNLFFEKYIFIWNKRKIDKPLRRTISKRVSFKYEFWNSSHNTKFINSLLYVTRTNVEVCDEWNDRKKAPLLCAVQPPCPPHSSQNIKGLPYENTTLPGISK